MALLTFPLSPLPANMTRWKDWAEDVQQYDSGVKQGATAYIKPLYQWSFPIKAMNELKQNSLWAFVDVVKQTTHPFLFKDIYDFRVNSVLAVRSGITNAATTNVFDINSFTVRPDTVYIGSLFSSLSGYVRLGVEYQINQDTGLLTVNTKATTDVWGVRSLQYWRKARFAAPWKETSIIWNVFGVDNIMISEEV